MAMSPRLLRPRASGATHPEARNWASRVVANGGGVGSSTLAAVSEFCATIDAQGLRDRFYRLSLMCGNDLSACLVPLYLAPAAGSSPLGNAVETNTGPFVSGDYSPTVGLTATVSTRALETGFSASLLDTVATGHVSAFPGSTQASDGQMISNAANDRHGIIFASSPNQVRGFWGANSSVVFVGQATASLGPFVVTRDSDTLMTLYSNGAAVSTYTPSVTPVSSASTFRLFSGRFSQFLGTMRGYSIGRTMTAAQVSTFTTAMQTFYSRIGRV